jgi:S1-C subfamily serine protease
MNRIGIALSCLLLTSTLCFGADEKQLPDEKIAEIGKGATVLVILGQNGQEKAFGSAFCIDQNGYFVTNQHVVGRDQTADLVISPGEKSQKLVKAKVLRCDEQLDLALLKVEEAISAAPIKLGSDQGLSEVQEIMAFGFPFGKELALNPGDYPSISINKGHITALRKKDGLLNRIQIDAVVNPGNSGGPIIDRSGNVVGVVVSGVLGAGAVNFAIPVSHIRKFLNKPDIQVVEPKITVQNRHSEAQLQVKVTSFFKSDYTVELTLSDSNGSRLLKPSTVENGCYTFKFIPEVEDPNPKVEFTVLFASGSVSGHADNRTIKIGDRNIQFSDMQRITLKPAEVLLASGEKVTGEIKGLGNLNVSLGNADVQIDPSKATTIQFNRPAASRQIAYKAVISYEGTSSDVSGTLVESGAVPTSRVNDVAGPAVAVEQADIKPLPMTSATSEIKLPSTIDDLEVGGGGRYIVMHLGKLRKLAIFDANKGDITNYISVPDNISFAAGLTKLIVCVTDSNILQRFNIDTCEREVSVQSPVPGTIRAAAMGSSSDGPLLLSVSAGTQELDRVSYHVVDIQKMSAAQLKPQATNMDPLVHYSSYRDLVHIRASADGTVFGMWCTSHSPSGLGTVSLIGSEASSHYEHDSRGHVLPGFDGSQIFTCGGVYSTELKKLQGNFQDGLAYIPSSQSSYFLGVSATMYPFNNEPGQKKDVSVFGPGDSRVLVKIPNVASIGKIEPWSKTDFTLDKRFHLLTKSNLLVVIPEQNDRLILHHFDLLEALKNSNIDYLFVSSTPPRSAFRGRQYKYRIAVESKMGEVKLKLDSGPKGMQLSDSGEVTWTPGDEETGESGVIVRISDKSGQEIFHSFNVKVQ